MSKVSQRRQTILSYFVEEGLLRNTFQIFPACENLTLQEAFETVAQINKELKRKEFDGAFSSFLENR